MDPAGVAWMATEVPPGTRVPLVNATGKLSTSSTPVIKYAPALTRGTFFALGGTGDLIPTLPSIAWRDELVLYTGRLNPAPEAVP